MLPARLLVAVVAIGAATGCASGSGAKDGGAVALVDAESGVGDAALLEAVVSFDGTCFVAVALDGTRYLPVFSRDAIWLDGPMLSWNGGLFADGDPIRLVGGGSMGVAQAADYVPEGCEYDGAWYVAV